MWILPRQLHTSAYVPDTEALNWDSTELSEACAQSLFVRSKVSPARTWSQKWKRDSWTQLLSGRILRPSHGQSFVTAWTSSLGAIPASPSAQPESASAQTTLATSGLLSQTEFGFCDPNSASLRMSKDTSASDSEKSLESWNQSVTKRRGEYSARLKSAHRTNASACLSWPTANARDWKDGSADCNQRAIDAGHQVTLARAATCWSTPSTMAGAMYPESNAAKRNSPSLASQVVMWPTPTTAEAGKISNQANFGQMGLSNHPEIVGIPTRPRMNKSGRVAQASDNKDGSRQGLWATPNTMDCLPPKSPEALARNLQKGGCRNLREDVVYRTGQWGTPAANDANKTPHCEVNSNQAGLAKSVGLELQKNQTGKLNGQWVTQLMGLPMGWVTPSCPASVIRNWPRFVSGWLSATIAPTNSDSSATESCQPQQNELFES